MKKVLSIVLCGLLLVSGLAFSGCSDANKLTVATNAEFEPFEYMDGKTIIGFDIDLINKIAEKIDMKVDIKNMEFESVVGAVQSGSRKCAISGLTITPKRKESVDFSNPYYTGASQMIIVKADDTAFTGTTKEELDGQLKNKKIGVCSGFTGASYVEGDADIGWSKIEGATAVTFDNISLAVADLKNGAIDCIVMDDIVAKNSTASDAAVKVVDVALSVEEYGIAVKKGDTELLGKINSALAGMKSDGTLDTLLAKWEID